MNRGGTTPDFFAAEVGADAQVTPHQKEMVEAQWLTPAEALSRNREGTLPLVFPTVFTLEELEPFKTPREALGFLRGRPVPRRLPILERTETRNRFSPRRLRSPYSGLAGLANLSTRIEDTSQIWLSSFFMTPSIR